MKSFGLGMGFGPSERFVVQAFFMLCVALLGLLGLFSRPGMPARSLRRRVLELDAVDGTNGHTQLTTRATRLDDGVHAFVRTNDRIGGACIQAKGAPNAPLLIDEGHLSGPLHTKILVQRQSRALGHPGQSHHALLASWGALVDGGVVLSNAPRIGLAVLIPTALALCLGKLFENVLMEQLGLHGTWTRGSS